MKKSNWKKVIALLLACVMMLCAATSCSSSGGGQEGSLPPETDSPSGSGGEATEPPSGPGTSGEPTVIRAGWQTTPITVTFFYADQQGWNAEKNLEIEPSFFANGYAVNEALASEDVDVSNTGAMLGILGSLAYGCKIIGWVEDDSDAIRVYARNDSDIVAAGKGYNADYPEIYGTPETWKGKNVITTSATSGYYGLLAALKTMGLSDTDVTVTDMEAASGAAAFLAGEGDLFATWDPNWVTFENDPEHYTCVSNTVNTSDSLICVFLMAEDYYNDPANRDTIVDYLEGMVRACDAFAKDEELYESTMVDWIAEYTSVAESDARRSAQIRPMYDLQGLLEWHEPDANGESKFTKTMLNIVDFMYDQGMIEQDEHDQLVNDTSWMDTSLMLEAIQNVMAEEG